MPLAELAAMVDGHLQRGDPPDRQAQSILIYTLDYYFGADLKGEPPSCWPM